MKKWKERLVNNWSLKLISLSIAFALWFVVISVNDPIDDKVFTNIKVNLTSTELLTDKGKVYEVLEGSNLVRTVSFEAPKSIREKIEAGDIIAEADFNDMTSTDTVPIRFSCPKYGSYVTNITGNISYVKLNVEEKISKWIDIRSNPVGKVAEGFVINSIKLDQNRLEIVGPKSKIESVSHAVVDVNVTDISNEISARGDIRLLNKEGVNMQSDLITQNTDNVKVNVVVYPEKEIPVQFNVTGEPEEGYMTTGEIESTISTIWVAGPYSTLNGITELVIPQEELDVTGVTENYVKEINLKKYLPGGIGFSDTGFDGKASVTVFVEEIEERKLEITRLNLQITNKPINRVIEYVDDVKIPELKIQGLNKDVSEVNNENIRGILDISKWMAEQEMETLPSGTYSVPVEFTLPEGVEQSETVYVTLTVMTPDEYASKAKYEELSNQTN